MGGRPLPRAELGSGPYRGPSLEALPGGRRPHFPHESDDAPPVGSLATLHRRPSKQKTIRQRTHVVFPMYVAKALWAAHSGEFDVFEAEGEVLRNGEVAALVVAFVLVDTFQGV
eukprot:GHVT01020943.1.p2 GENE.GHVT01020943.1~~GHVT01020943.1.p2  ORF type:complete len:114 (+),score=18.57 GHVT01020943.1:1084-1425(+)